LCDPLTLGSLAIGAAGTAANSIGQANAAKKQNAEYDAWVATQRKNRTEANARQDELRQQAEAARELSVQQLSGESQKAEQDTEQARLEAELAGETEGNTEESNTAKATADAQLTGSQYAGDVYQQDFANQLSKAMSSAKDRIKALATVQSYGGSANSLANQNAQALATSGQEIDLANNKRRGELAAYQIAQAVEPESYTYSNPIADVASQFLGAGMQGVGSAAAGNSTGGSTLGNFLGSITSGNKNKNKKKSTGSNTAAFS
jgi:hypothetical protein